MRKNAHFGSPSAGTEAATPSDMPSNGEAPDVGEVGSTAAQVLTNLGQLGRALAARRDDLMAPLGRLAEARPLAVVGLAFGLGYVLGGGLFARTTSRLLAIGLRLGALGFARGATSRM